MMLFRRSFFTFAISLALIISGCASVPKATDDRSSAIAITVDVDVYSNPMAGTANLAPETVFFVRLPGDLKGEILYSNFKTESWLSPLKSGGTDSFLMNIPPGTYAAVAVSGISSGNSPFSAGGNAQSVFFPEDAFKASIVTVNPGAIVYMGRFNLNRVAFWNGMKEADKCQTFYFNALNDNGYTRFLSQPYATTTKKIENSSKDEKAFLEGHIGTFKNTDWEARIKTRLKEIGE